MITRYKRGAIEEHFKDDNEELLAALNGGKVESLRWSSAEGIQFGRSLAVMVEDLRSLSAQFTSGAHDTRAIVRAVERLRPQLERPRYQRIFYPDTRRHRLGTMIVPVASSVEAESEERLLATLGNLIEMQKLDLLRVCPHCELWYLGTRSDKEYCSNNCRQRSFQKKQPKISKQKRGKRRGNF